MADQPAGYPIPPQPNLTTTDFDPLPIPPLDPAFFSDDLTLPDNFLSFENDVEDFDFTFDDIYLPSDTEEFLNPPGSDPESGYSDPICVDQGSGVLNFTPTESDHDRSSDFAGFLNLPSPDSGACNGANDVGPTLSQDSGNCGSAGPSSSQGSGSCGVEVEPTNYSSPDSGNSARSPDSGNSARSVVSSHNSGNTNSANEVIVDQKVKIEELGKNSLFKRKKDSNLENLKSDVRSSKYRRSNAVENVNQSYSFSAGNGDDEKRKARLIRNRESAQLSRQRKKHYVEELEDKVRAMHSTIQDLSAKISYVVGENASLRQQLGCGGAVCPPQMAPQGMYPHPPLAPVGYPWMPCPPYVVKPQGSQVPLVPIPRLKPQQPASAPKTKKVESKKTEGRTKKVASISFLGLLFFIFLFGGLVPTLNVKYGARDAFPGGSDYLRNLYYDQHRGRVLAVDVNHNGTNHNVGIGIGNLNEKLGSGKDFTNTLHHGRGHVGGAESGINKKHGMHPLPCSDGFVRLGNDSEPLIASLYVPRNDKLVKIDGNLIIHSVLASEKAMASHEDVGTKSVRETGLAVSRNVSPAISIAGGGSSIERQRALASGSAGKDNLKSSAGDGELQQWFREGLAGPLLSSGMCTEVFQFDVSPASNPGGIVPAASVRNISAEHLQNSTYLTKGKNRRILHGLPIPLPGSSHNITTERVGSNSEKESSRGNTSLSSMVVSVLVDPKEAGDVDGEGMVGKKSLTRIFVVVLLDSVKYVTYSCVLPLVGSSAHLVTT
ncbi:hypothetical protein RJ639_004040 [Escallonia herrerae]|uniref:BZIP domain-containing protein n=1 Tax=Escallonia herrerae TaxID=1293975 RepID=A0AA88W4F2_9ASTE|nr:hypothetical protein RJ639_004040 [Escallonia herrerae]